MKTFFYNSATPQRLIVLLHPSALLVIRNHPKFRTFRTFELENKLHLNFGTGEHLNSGTEKLLSSETEERLNLGTEEHLTLKIKNV